MLDDREFKTLTSIKPEGARAPACIMTDKGAIVHSDWYVFEFAHDQYSTQKSWPGKPIEGARQWRYEFVPQDETGEAAHLMRETWAGDDEDPKVVKLVSSSFKAYLKEAMHEFLDNQFDQLSYRLYTPRDGKPSAIGVFSKGKLVGVVGYLLPNEA